MKKTIAVLLVVLTVSVIKGQFGMGGSLSGNYLFTSGMGVMVGAGGFGEKGYEYGKKMRSYSTRVGVNFFLPKTISRVVEAYAYSNLTNPYYIELTTKNKVSLIAINVDQKRYFGNGDLTDGGVYVGVGAGAWLATQKITYPTYNDADYGVSEGASNYTKTYRYFQLMVRGFFGYEKSVGKVNLFGEVVVSAPATNVNGMAVDISLPPSAGIQFGVRYNIN